MITGLHHVNLVVPTKTLSLANEFYSDTLGLIPRTVPQLQRETLAWFDIGNSGQQVHIAFGKPEDFTNPSSRHPCFRVSSGEELIALQRKVWEHYERGGESAPKAADKPGEQNSGAAGVEYPTRFFARYVLTQGLRYRNANVLCSFQRDYAGNRLEFTL